mmetsp:Transcript_13456/g.28029  ORF Transcript_13456/g.28029 Transcript_13456/m.28029 type:complete len:96 (-) Transcript_13456:563-850(-)
MAEAGPTASACGHFWRSRMGAVVGPSAELCEGCAGEVPRTPSGPLSTESSTVMLFSASRTTVVLEQVSRAPRLQAVHGNDSGMIGRVAAGTECSR